MQRVFHFSRVSSGDVILRHSGLTNLAVFCLTSFFATGFASSLIAQETGFFRTAGCVDCHSGTESKGALNLTTLLWNPDEPGNVERWEKLHDRVQQGEMPPVDSIRPDPAAMSGFLKSVATPLHALREKQHHDQGRTGLRRLNRIEYENTVHALLGIDQPLMQLLPEDGGSHFDTVAAELRFSQLQIEKYLEAADLALDAALDLTPPVESTHRQLTLLEDDDIRNNLEVAQGTITNPASHDKHQVLFRRLPDAMAFFSETYQLLIEKSAAPVTGDYRIRVSGQAFQSRGEPVTLILMSDNYQRRRIIGTWELPADAPRVIECTTRLEEREMIRVMPHGVNYNDAGKGVWGTDAAVYDGVGMSIQWIEIEGPLQEKWPPSRVILAAGDVPLRKNIEPNIPWRDGKRIVFELAPEDPKAAIETQLSAFAVRAFRRPVDASETEDIIHLGLQTLAAGELFERALRIGLKAILTSPQFLIFDERPGELDDFALANRLSYFLTSGPPDAALIQLATEHRLHDDVVLRGEVRRLLSDSRSARFVRNFAGQWLNLRAIDATSPDSMLYPEFDDVLKRSMVAETEAFFAEMVRCDSPVSDFIQSDWLMLNRRLGQHYGIPGADTEKYVRVAVPPDNPRGGVLTQAAILKVTANGTTTSPVVRGTWVLKRLLNRPPAPPPPVPAIEPDTRGATTVRELLGKHRSSQTCNSCHRQIDPPGFALECFDVIGGWRDRYRSIEKGDPTPGKLRGDNIWQYKQGLPVDSTGELADGRSFLDIRSYKQLLLQESDTVLRAVAGNLLTYGTGATLDFADRAAVDRIAKETNANGGGLRRLIEEVVLSQTFRHQ